MTQFNFSVWNHDVVSRIVLRDLVDHMSASIIGLGFPPPLITDNFSNEILMFEMFDTESLDYLRRIERPFGLICTEWFEGGRLKGHKDERCQSFLEAVEMASFLWSVIDEPAYAELGKPYAPVTPSWEEGFYSRHTERPTYDICVFGTPNYVRKKIRERLDRIGINYAWMNPGTSTDERNKYIWNSRFVLGLPATGVVGEPSPGRVAIAMHNDRPVLSLDELDRFWELRDNWEDIRVQQISQYAMGPQYRTTMQKALEVAGYEIPVAHLSV